MAKLCNTRIKSLFYLLESRDSAVITSCLGISYLIYRFINRFSHHEFCGCYLVGSGFGIFGIGCGSANRELGNDGEREHRLFGIGSSVFGHFTRFSHYDFGNGVQFIGNGIAQRRIKKAALKGTR